MSIAPRGTFPRPQKNCLVYCGPENCDCMQDSYDNLGEIGMPLSANDRQVGGNHYKGAEYEHWDFSWDLGLDGITHTATKYLSRWRKKDGLQDLEKVDHYFEKLLELNKNEQGPRRFRTLNRSTEMRIFWRFVDSYKLSPAEVRIMYWLCFWSTSSDLGNGRDLMQAFIAQQRAQAAGISTDAIVVIYQPMVGGTPTDPLGDGSFRGPDEMSERRVPRQDSSKHAPRSFKRTLSKFGNGWANLSPTLQSYYIEIPGTTVMHVDPKLLSEEEWDLLPKMRPNVNSHEYEQLPDWTKAMYLPRDGAEGEYQMISMFHRA